MADDLSYFVWRVPEGGFEWLQIKGFPTRVLDGGVVGAYLVNCMEYGVLSRVRNYSPLTETGLFHRFAGTESTKEGVLAFANQYGCLGGKLTLPVTRPTLEKAGEEFIVAGEMLEGWELEITSMRHAIEMWDMLRGADAKGLARFIYWQQCRIERGGPILWRVLYHSPLWGGLRRQGSRVPGGSVIASQHDPAGLAELQINDVIGPGWHALQRVVNEKLTEHIASPKLLGERSRKGTELKIRFVPDSLISALWFQFARAIDGNRHYGCCSECRNWFEVGGARTNRADKKFCSPTCKAKAHRKKIAQARALRAAGVPEKEIARRLETSLSKVKDWVRA